MRRLEKKGNPFGDAGAFGLVDFTIGAETGGTTKNVALQFKTANGDDVQERVTCLAYLSDDAHGDSVIATAHSSGAAIGTDGLAIPLVANKAFLLTSESDGDLDLNFVEAGAKTAYLVIVLPDGSLTVSGAITHAT